MRSLVELDSAFRLFLEHLQDVEHVPNPFFEDPFTIGFYYLTQT